jgi:S1-C subfamily serine protease
MLVRRWSLACCLLGLAAVALAGEEATDGTVPVRDSVFFLAVEDLSGVGLGSGTGFVFGREGWVVTNHHVVEQAAGIVVETHDGRTWHASGILAGDADSDLAVIEVPGLPFPPLPAADPAVIGEGLPVATYGYPIGMRGTANLAEGKVTARRPGGYELKGQVLFRTPRVQHSARVDGGCSGSPVLGGPDGGVVGVIDSGLTSRADLNFFVPIDQLQALVASIDPAKPARAFPGRGWGISLNLGISAAFFLALFGLFWYLGRKR